MFLDLSFEYDACFEEFKNERVSEIINGDIWISYHTDLGREFLEYFGWYGDIHKRFKADRELVKKIKEFASKSKLNSTIGGFYWKDIKHTKHLG